MTILRPIARASEFIGLDRLVDSANRAIGRNGATPGGVGAAVGARSATSTTVTTLGPSGPSTSIPGRGATTTPGHAVGLPQPSAADPITVLNVGDSIGEDLGIGLSDELGSKPAVHFVEDAVGDTGLADAKYYNWPAQLESELVATHPAIVTMMFGGNDWQPFYATATRIAQPGTAFWRQAYGAIVAEMMQEATSAGARVIWVGLPIMGPTSQLPTAMAPGLNSVYASEASSHPGVTYFSSWQLFTTTSGAYAEYLPDSTGSLVQVRDPDGVHIDPPAGTDLLGAAVVADIEHLYAIHL